MSSAGTAVYLCYVWVSFLSLISYANSCTNVEVGYPEGGILDWPPYDDYPSNANECWVVHYAGDPRHGDRVTMTITTVAIEDSSGCSNDALEIRDRDSTGPVLARLCGYQACGHVTSSSNSSLYLTFRSDGSVEKGGFFAKLEVTGPGHSEYSHTTWQPAECFDDDSDDGSFSFSQLGILVVVAVAVTVSIAAGRYYRIKRMRMRSGCCGAVVAVPGTTSGVPPPPPPGIQGGVPQTYAPPPYPSSATQQYTPGAYPAQLYPPTVPNPPPQATADPSAPLTGYWNPALEGPPAPTAYSTAPPPSYEQVTAPEKYVL